MNKIREIDSSLIDQNENSIRVIHLFLVKKTMNDSELTHILKATLEYILSTERFNIPLFE